MILRNPPPPRLRSGPPPSPQPQPWRAVLSSDPTEHAFLVTLRATPSDPARVVYADWLEQQDDSQRAAFTRHEGALSHRRMALGTGDAAWRSITSRGDIAMCGRDQCPGRWDRLTATDDERLRSCTRCALTVRYCESRTDAESAGYEKRPIVVDVAGSSDEIESWYQQATLRRHSDDVG